MISVAEALRDAGHEPLLLASPPFGRAAGERGIAWREIGRDHQQMLAETAKLKPQEIGAYLKHHRTEQTAAEIDALLEYATDAGVIVGSGVPLGAQTVAEYLKVPYRYLALAPAFYHSGEWGDPLAAMIMPAEGRMAKRFSWVLGGFLGRAMGKTVNPHRARLGLKPYRDATDAIWDRGGRPILAAHPQLAPIPADVKERIARCGAIRQPDAKAISEATERYLADGEPPVFVGFGSMLGMQPTALATVAAAVAKTGRRGIFAGDVWDGIELPGGSLRCGTEPQEKLFTRVATVVSHGGAGTVAQAFWAGAPQVVVTFGGGDQPYWGRATVAAGVAPASFALTKVDAHALTRAVAEAVGGEYAARARELAAEVAQTDGASDVAAETVRRS
jgi:UDP:flavonoid glycosyltransferase YjiC (YdhE family)